MNITYYTLNLVIKDFKSKNYTCREELEGDYEWYHSIIDKNDKRITPSAYQYFSKQLTGTASSHLSQFCGYDTHYIRRRTY